VEENSKRKRARDGGVHGDVPVRDLKKMECVSFTDRLSTTTKVRSAQTTPRMATRASNATAFIYWGVKW
jgi:hypothetical protein